MKQKILLLGLLMTFVLAVALSAQTFVSGNFGLTSDNVWAAYGAGGDGYTVWATAGYYPGGSTYERTITLHFLGTFHVFIIVNGTLVLQPGDWHDGVPTIETTVTYGDSSPIHITGGWGNGGQIDFWLYPAVPATNISFSTAGGWHPAAFTVTPVVHAAPGLSIIGGNYAPVTVTSEGETDLNLYRLRQLWLHRHSNVCGKDRPRLAYRFKSMASLQTFGTTRRTTSGSPS